MKYKLIMIILVLVSLSVTFSVYGLTPNETKKEQPKRKIYTIQGKVLSPKGEPLEGALIRMNLYSNALTKTDKKGLFELQHNNILFSIEAWHPLYPNYRAIWFHLNLEYPVLILKKTFDVQGRVTDKEDKPISNANIHLSSAGFFSASGFGSVTTVSTDTDGKYLLKDLLPDQLYSVKVSAKNYVPIEIQHFSASGGWLNSTLGQLERIQMESGNQITVLVIDRNGKPISGANVTSGHPGWIKTDLNGIAVLDNLPLGKIHISVDYQNVWQGKDYIIADPKEIIRIQFGD